MSQTMRIEDLESAGVDGLTRYYIPSGYVIVEGWPTGASWHVNRSGGDRIASGFVNAQSALDFAQGRSEFSESS